MFKRFRFSLKLFLLLVVALSVVLAVLAERAHRQRNTVAEIIVANGIVYYSNDSGVANIERNGFFFHVFNSVDLVTLQPNQNSPADEQIYLICELPKIRRLAIGLNQML